MDNHIEEGRLLLLKNKVKVFKYYFIENVLILIVLDIFFLKTFSWWEIPLDIVLSAVIAIVSSWLQVRWNRRREKENAYFKEKYGKK